MGNASQINHSRNPVLVERRSDLNESDLSEVYCISLGGHFVCSHEVGFQTENVQKDMFTQYNLF